MLPKTLAAGVFGLVVGLVILGLGYNIATTRVGFLGGLFGVQSQLQAYALNFYIVGGLIVAVGLSLAAYALTSKPKQDIMSYRSQAIKIARDAARDAGYQNAKVIDAQYDKNTETFEVEMQEGEAKIRASIDAESGEVIDFTKD